MGTVPISAISALPVSRAEEPMLGPPPPVERPEDPPAYEDTSGESYSPSHSRNPSDHPSDHPSDDPDSCAESDVFDQADTNGESGVSSPQPAPVPAEETSPPDAGPGQQINVFA